MPYQELCMLFAHISSKPRGNFSQRASHVALLRGHACTLKDKFKGKSEELFSRGHLSNYLCKY